MTDDTIVHHSKSLTTAGCLNATFFAARALKVEDTATKFLGALQRGESSVTQLPQP